MPNISVELKEMSICGTAYIQQVYKIVCPIARCMVHARCMLQLYA